jgi:hypothetical protein
VKTRSGQSTRCTRCTPILCFRRWLSYSSSLIVQSKVPASVLLGIAIMVVFLLAIRSQIEQINPAYFYCAMWILATAFPVAWMREGASASRYSIYSLLLLIFCYSFLSEHLRERSFPFRLKYVYVGSLVLAVLFCAPSDRNASRQLPNRRQMVIAGIGRYRSNPSVDFPINIPNWRKVTRYSLSSSGMS